MCFGACTRVAACPDFGSMNCGMPTLFLIWASLSHSACPPWSLPHPAQCGLRTQNCQKDLKLVAKPAGKVHWLMYTQYWWLFWRLGLSLCRCASAPCKVCRVRAVERFKENAEMAAGRCDVSCRQPLVGQVPGAFADHSTCQSLVHALNVQRCLVAFPRSHAKEWKSRGSG